MNNQIIKETVYLQKLTREIINSHVYQKLICDNKIYEDKVFH